MKLEQPHFQNPNTRASLVLQHMQRICTAWRSTLMSRKMDPRVEMRHLAPALAFATGTSFLNSIIQSSKSRA